MAAGRHDCGILLVLYFGGLCRHDGIGKTWDQAIAEMAGSVAVLDCALTMLSLRSCAETTTTLQVDSVDDANVVCTA